MRFRLLAIGLLTACSQGKSEPQASDSGATDIEADTDTDTDADTDADTDTDTDTDTDDGDHIWSAGPFQFATVDVEDRCLDGTANVLLMPEGDGIPQPWANPIDLPGWGALSVPQSVSVSLPSPLADMSLTLTRAEEIGTVWVTDGDQTSVLFDEDSYMDCEVDFNVNAVIYILNNDSLTGTATLSVTTATGGFCPRINTPCDVLVHFEATRL